MQNSYNPVLFEPLTKTMSLLWTSLSKCTSNNLIFLKCLQTKLFFKLSDKILDIFPIVNKVFGLSFLKEGTIFYDRYKN